MPTFKLFPDDQIVGVFIGFREGGMEFHADLVLPYRSEFQSVPMHGQFVLVQLETPEEAVLGRITAFEPAGKLAQGAGEEFTLRALRERRPVPEDLRQDYLKYRVNIRVLGVLRARDEELLFVPSHRRLPHLGSPVAFASPPVLQEIAGHNDPGAVIGHLALGEYIYAEGSELLQPQAWMQVKSPEVQIRFPVENLVSRRSFVFARAGFGKSNLIKLLFSELYRNTPTVLKRGGRQVPVGTLIFDPDGEYFWPDDKGRPGLCDVPWLEDKLVIFTSRRAPSAFYGSFVAGSTKLDIRTLRPRDVVRIALPADRQEQQNVRKLAALNDHNWRELVNLIHDHGYQAELGRIQELLGLESSQEAEALAARSNMTTIVNMIHDPHSQLMALLLHALKAGKLCVVDVSQMSGGQALILSGLILRYIFDHNQEHFTAANPETIPVIAVVEEAQAVLDERKSGTEPYITWVKEGRKYDLGALMVTQQPGSIPKEILSQGDNWFIFHLLSRADLAALNAANAHFSEDLLSALLNEPIVGQGVFWSSVSGHRSYPVPVRALSFEKLTPLRDPEYCEAAADTYAMKLRREAEERILRAAHQAGVISSNGDGYAGHTGVETTRVETIASTSQNPGSEVAATSTESIDEPVTELDPMQVYELLAVKAVRDNEDVRKELESRGMLWGRLQAVIRDSLPKDILDRDDLAYKLVPTVLNRLYGPERAGGWHTTRDGNRTWIRCGPRGETT